MSATITLTEPLAVSRHDLVMTLREGPVPFHGHCACERWSHRTADWSELGTRWAWHHLAMSGGSVRQSFARAMVKAELQAHDEYGGDCRNCGYPVVRGRTRCRSCERTVAPDEDAHGPNCECPSCWEDTVARRHARDAAHQADTCPDCGNCLSCEDPDSPDHAACICAPEATT